MSCSTCERRQTSCDASRPRCGTCARVHLKCVYTSPPTAFEFQDLTESVTAQLTSRKRRKTSKPKYPNEQVSNTNPIPIPVMDNNQDNGFLSMDSFDPDSILSFDVMPSPDFATWEHDLYGEFLADSAMEQPFPQVTVGMETSEYNLFKDQTIQSEPLPTSSGPAVESKVASIGTVTEHTPTSSSLGVEDDKPVQEPSAVPKHILAQHYSLTALQVTKNRSWNFYMHFYNRFATIHPPVLSAIYAYTSAHLLYSKKLGSMESALSHYHNCLSELSSLYGITIINASASSAKEYVIPIVEKLDKEGLDVVIISLYFLALFDLLTTRPVKLRQILRIMPVVIRSRDRKNLSGTFLRVATWFVYLDTRASLFGLGDGTPIYTVGDEDELVQTIYGSRNVLQDEYNMLYPSAEREIDKFALPTLARVLEITVIFREISRYDETADESIKNRIRQRIDEQNRVMEISDDKTASQNRAFKYSFTVKALYNAVEIYYSRTFSPKDPLYSANKFAVAILTMTERMHRVLEVPQTETPNTKTWPIPMIMAAIEVQDPIHRSWALRKLQDYQWAGNNYKSSSIFAERVCQIEETKGVRVRLGDVMKSMDEEFIV